jgi:hypothetical protein
MSFIFSQKIDENFIKVLKMKNDLIEKCMAKVRTRNKVEHRDLAPIIVSKEQIVDINRKLDKIKSKTFFIMIYFLGMISFSLRYTYKLHKLNVPKRKAILTWVFTFLSSNFLFKNYEGSLQESFEGELENIVIDYVFENNLNDKDKDKKKELYREQYKFYIEQNNLNKNI